MSALAFDLSVARESFRLELALESNPGVTVLFGPSGSGKSTTLAALAGLVRPERGRIVLGERTLFDTTVGLDLPAHSRGLGLVFQEGLLFPHLTVGANLRYGAPRARSRATALPDRDVVSALELEPFLDRLPATLSGGERQRVALGRALLSGPDALLLDEPLASLDRDRRARIVPFLQKTKTRFPAPILYVTHALDEALALGDRVCLLHEGRKVALGSPGDVFGAPRDPLVARLSGFDNVLALVVVEHDAEDGVTRARLGSHVVSIPRVSVAAGEPVRVGLAATDVLLATHPPDGLSARNVVPATVASVERGEAGVSVRVEVAGEPPVEVVARLVPSAVRALSIEPGAAVFLVWKSTAPRPLEL